MRLTIILMAAFGAYWLGIWALWMPYGLWLLVWVGIMAALVVIGRWVV